MLIRFVVHTPSPADTGFPDIDPHRAGAHSAPYFAPFAGANHPLPALLMYDRGWSRYIGPREKLTPVVVGASTQNRTYHPTDPSTLCAGPSAELCQDPSNILTGIPLIYNWPWTPTRPDTYWHTLHASPDETRLAVLAVLHTRIVSIFTFLSPLSLSHLTFYLCDVQFVEPKWSNFTQQLVLLPTK